MASSTDDLRGVMAADPGAVFEQVAHDHGVTVQAALAALPEGMARFAPGESFGEAMAEIAEWGDVTVIVHTDDGIFEFTGPVPPGKEGRGYFNLAGRTGFHGHLRAERCAAIAFLEREFMGRASASVLFVNVDGGFMFKVFVGRATSGGELRPDQLAAFRSLAERVCAARPAG